MTCGKAECPPLSCRDRRRYQQLSLFFLPSSCVPWAGTELGKTPRLQKTSLNPAGVFPGMRKHERRAFITILFLFAALRKFLPRRLFILCFPLLWTSCVHTHAHTKKTSFEERRGGLKACKGLGSATFFFFRVVLPLHSKISSSLPPLFYSFNRAHPPLLFLAAEAPPPRKHLPFCTTSRHLPSRVL